MKRGKSLLPLKLDNGEEFFCDSINAGLGTFLNKHGMPERVGLVRRLPGGREIRAEYYRGRVSIPDFDGTTWLYANGSIYPIRVGARMEFSIAQIPVKVKL